MPVHEKLTPTAAAAAAAIAAATMLLFPELQEPMTACLVMLVVVLHLLHIMSWNSDALSAVLLFPAGA
jgi:hypothetical protein